jgi:hypothetical protein
MDKLKALGYTQLQFSRMNDWKQQEYEVEKQEGK